MHDRSTHRLARLLAAFAMPFALIAAFFAATPAPVGAGQASTANLAFQIFTCPLGYSGDEYLFDCTPGPAGDEITVAGAADGSTATGTTADDGTYALDYPAGETTVTFGLTAPNTFYYACFDTTSGSEVYLFDGTTNTTTLDTLAGGSYSCRFYVTPSEGVPGDNVDDAATFEFQVFQCPVEYEGDEYLNDCAPLDPSNPIEVQLASGPEFDIESDGLLTGSTGDEGRIPFRLLPPGTWSAALNISERVNSFYYACFDTTSGEEIFLFDGGGVQLTGEIATGGILSCRWYIIPQELPSPLPTIGALDVTVSDAETGEPIPGTCVQLTTEQFDPIGDRVCDNVGEGETGDLNDEPGAFALGDIEPGTYVVLFEELPAEYQGPDAGLGPTVTIEAGQTTTAEQLITAIPGAVPSDDTFGATAEFQVYDCPVAYEGDEYLTDCAPADAEFPVEVQLSGGPELDPETALSGTTDEDGFVRFLGLDAGTYTAYLNVPGEFATFYLACFDATGGGETFLYDGESNLTTFEVAEDATISCRWYIVPEDLRGSVEPSASATVVPSASDGDDDDAGGPVTGLPSTGTGTDGTTLPGGALAAAAVMAVIAVAFATRRLVIDRP